MQAIQHSAVNNDPVFSFHIQVFSVDLNITYSVATGFGIVQNITYSSTLEQATNYLVFIFGIVVDCRLLKRGFDLFSGKIERSNFWRMWE